MVTRSALTETHQSLLFGFLGLTHHYMVALVGSMQNVFRRPLPRNFDLSIQMATGHVRPIGQGLGRYPDQLLPSSYDE